MSAAMLDAELILSTNEQWKKLDEKWGPPIDLDTELIDEEVSKKMQPVFSCLDVTRTTFDSSCLLKTVKMTKNHQLSKTSLIKYKDFIQDLQQELPQEEPRKQFYFIGGQILSAYSVEEICEKVDDIFKSIERLCSATSTLRYKQNTPEIVHRSASYNGLSFDDTDDEKEKCDSDDVDKYIDEAFDHLNSTLASVATRQDINEATRESVTALVKKFTSVLNNPHKCGPRRKRQCSDRFRELLEFWSPRAVEIEETH